MSITLFVHYSRIVVVNEETVVVNQEEYNDYEKIFSYFDSVYKTGKSAFIPFSNCELPKSFS